MAAGASTGHTRCHPQYDQERPLFADLQCWGAALPKIMQVLDMFGPYSYPLPTGTYQRHAGVFGDRMRELAERKYVHGVLQCGGAWAPDNEYRSTDLYEHQAFMTPDQLRLEVFHGISHGLRGIVYWPVDNLLPRRGPTAIANGDRLNEAAIIGCELEYLGPLIVGGDAVEGATTNQPEVTAYQIDGDGYTLVVLTKMRDDYSRAMDEAVAQNLQVHVPGHRFKYAWSLTAPRVEPLKVAAQSNGCQVTLPRLEIASVIVLSGDATVG